MCTKECRKLSDAIQDAERIESAFGRANRNPICRRDTNSSKRSDEPMPMDIKNIHEKKINEAENISILKKKNVFAVAKKDTWLRIAQKNKVADV